MSDHIICQRCGGAMDIGFIVDLTYGTRTDSKWVPGEPERSIWTGVKVPIQYPVRTFRCADCGWLDSYAFAPQK